MKKPKKTYEEKRKRAKDYYYDIQKPKSQAKNIYHPDKLKTPRKPIEETIKKLRDIIR